MNENETMVSGVTRGGSPAGTSLQGYLTASYARLVALLGEPEYKRSAKDKGKCGDGKVSTEWVLTFEGKTYTIYDYKETSLYGGRVTPESFRKRPSYEWHVGGRGDASAFIRRIEAYLAGAVAPAPSKDEPPKGPSKRKFWKTVIQVTVLSEEPIGEPELDDLYYMITDGPCSGDCKTVSEDEVDGPTMAKLLEEQGSDPGFFRLDEHGQDADEE